jgi:hypothetical protein
MSAQFGNPAYAFWRDVADGLAPKMAAAGFQRREATWYWYAGDVLQMVDLAYREKSLGLRLGIVVRRLNSETHPSYAEAHLGVGLQWLTAREDVVRFDAVRDLRGEVLDADETVEVFCSCLERYGFPALDRLRTMDGIRALIRRDRGRPWQVKRELFEGGVLGEY